MAIKTTNFVGNQFNTENGIVREYSFLDLAKQFSRPIQGVKHLGYFVRGELDPVDRADDNLKYSELLVIDGDATLEDEYSCVPPEDVHNALVDMNIRHFIYTSHSHDPEKKKHKFRAIIHCILPEKKYLKPTAEKIIYDLNLKGIPIKYVKEMGTWSQPWFIPSRDDIDDGKFEFFYHGDESYDDSRQTAKYKAVKESGIPEHVIIGDKKYNTQSDSSSFDEKVHEMLTKGTFHNGVRDILYALVKDGSTDSMAFNIVKGILRSVPVGNRNDSWEREVAHEYAEVARSLEGVRARLGVAENEDEKLNSPLPEGVISDISWPPGLMGELARSVYDYSHHQYKLVSIITAMALVAGICGRKYNVSRTGLNVYITLLMRTGAGKNVIQQYITEFLTKDILSLNRCYLGPKRFTSPKAILDYLADKPSMVSVQTEAGLMFKSSAGDQHGILRTMLDLYSSSGANAYSGAEAYSNSDNSLPVLRAPALTIVNEATPETFESEMITRGSIESGELARMHIFRFDAPKPYANENGGKMIISDKLEKRMNDIMAKCKGQKCTGEGSDPNVIDIDYPQDIYREFSNNCVDEENRLRGEDGLKVAMLTRAPIKVLKTAGLLAVLDNEVITEEHWEWALELYHYEFSLLSGLMKGGAGGDVDLIIESVLMPAAVKIVKGEYKDKKKRVNNYLMSEKIFTLSSMNQAVKNNKRLKEIGSKFKPGLLVALDHMVQLEMLEEIHEDQVKHYARSSHTISKGYRITRSFIATWNDSLADLNVKIFVDKKYPHKKNDMSSFKQDPYLDEF